MNCQSQLQSGVRDSGSVMFGPSGIVVRVDTQEKHTGVPQGSIIITITFIIIILAHCN